MLQRRLFIDFEWVTTKVDSYYDPNYIIIEAKIGKFALGKLYHTLLHF